LFETSILSVFQLLTDESWLKRNFPGWKLPMTLPRSLSSEGVVAKWKSVFFVAYGLLEEARQKRL